MGRVAIRVEGLSKTYEGGGGIRNISLEVRLGELLGVIGPNGSGKTTLLRCLAGLLKPRGAVYLDGRTLNRVGLRELARTLAYIPSEYEGQLGLTVYEVVSAGRTPHMKGIWWESEEDEEIIRESMRALGVEGMAERRMSGLSSGERQKVRLARALAQRPRILLVDEPTSHLDPRNQIEIMETLRALTRMNVAVVAVLHDLNLASAYCDRLLVLKDGIIAACGEPSEILNEELVWKVFGVRVKIVWSPGLGRPVIVPLLEKEILRTLDNRALDGAEGVSFLQDDAGAQERSSRQGQDNR